MLILITNYFLNVVLHFLYTLEQTNALHCLNWSRELVRIMLRKIFFSNVSLIPYKLIILRNSRKNRFYCYLQRIHLLSVFLLPVLRFLELRDGLNGHVNATINYKIRIWEKYFFQKFRRMKFEVGFPVSHKVGVLRIFWSREFRKPFTTTNPKYLDSHKHFSPIFHDLEYEYTVHHVIFTCLSLLSTVILKLRSHSIFIQNSFVGNQDQTRLKLKVEGNRQPLKQSYKMKSL